MQRLTKGTNIPSSRDGGAVAVIFALCLVVLVGFVGLGVDVASAYAKSQEAQNAADAAALAVAQSCADKELPACPQVGRDDALAQDLAEQNVRLEIETVSTDVEYPASNQVKVTVEADSRNFFVPLFGVDSFTVREDATAEWNYPQAGPSMLPLTISACNFYDTAGDPLLGENVFVWLPKGKLLEDNPIDCGTLSYPPGGFGWLEHTDCEVNVEVGVYAPGDNGANRPDACLQAALQVGEEFLIPIFDAHRGTGSNAEFRIHKFAALKLLGWHFTEGGPTIGEPVKCLASTRPSGSDYRDACLNVEFQSWVELDDEYTGGGPAGEVAIISLVD